MAKSFGIADLAREFAVTPRAIRFYEDEGLITPERRGTQRIYSARDRVRLMLILRGRRLGFALKDIRDIIDLYDAPSGEAGQLALMLDKLKERRARLEAQAEDIRLTLTELEEIERQCASRLAELGQGREAAE